MVVIYHASIHYRMNGGLFPLTFFKYIGFSGVDVFFVVSGFIIHRTTRGISGPKNALWFAYRRACRIFVPYWPIVLLWLAILAGFGSIDLVSKVTGWKTFLLWPAPLNQIMIDVTWTLSYELYFYLVFGIAIAFGSLRWAILALFVLFTAGCAIIDATGLFSLPYLLRFVANPLIFEFMFGVAVSYFALKYRYRNWPVLLSNAVLGFIIVGLVCMHYDLVLAGPVKIFMRVLTYGLLSSVLVYAVVCMEGKVRLAPNLVVLGDASYSLYLIHRLTISLVWGLWPAAGFALLTTQPEIAWVLVVFGSLALSLVYFAYVEKPLLRIAQSLAKDRTGAGPDVRNLQGKESAAPEGQTVRRMLRVAGIGALGLGLSTSAAIVSDAHSRRHPSLELPARQLVLKDAKRAPLDFAASDRLTTHDIKPRLTAANHLVAAGSGFAIEGNDPYFSYSLPGDGLSGAETPYLGFAFTCEGQKASPRIQIFWWGDGARGPSERSSASFRMYRDTIVVPVGVSRDWSSTKLLSGVRIDLMNPSACRSVNVSDLRFYRFDRE